MAVLALSVAPVAAPVPVSVVQAASVLLVIPIPVAPALSAAPVAVRVSAVRAVVSAQAVAYPDRCYRLLQMLRSVLPLHSPASASVLPLPLPLSAHPLSAVRTVLLFPAYCRPVCSFFCFPAHLLCQVVPVLRPLHLPALLLPASQALNLLPFSRLLPPLSLLLLPAPVLWFLPFFPLPASTPT